MKSTAEPSGSHMVKGTFLLFLAGSLLLPSGFVTAVYLSRKLGPGAYGLFAVLTRFVLWIEMSGTTAFHDVSLQFAGENKHDMAVRRLILRTYLILGCFMSGLLFLGAGHVAALFNEPGLVPYLKLISVEIPLFCIASACRIILIGEGAFRQASLVNAFKIVMRLVLIVLFVESGLSLSGAILGMIGATCLEMLFCFRFVKPTLVGNVSVPGRRIASLGGPVLLSKAALSVVGMDLFALKLLGGTAVQAGYYGAALNLAFVPGLYGMALSRTLHSTLVGLHSAGERGRADAITHTAIRSVLMMLPFAAMTVGLSSEIVLVVFGPAFAPAAPVLSFCIFVPVFLLFNTIGTVVMITRNKPGLCLFISIPMMVLVILGHVMFTQKFGGIGAAAVTAFVSGLGGLASITLMKRIWSVEIPWKTLGRAGIASAAAFYAASAWAAAGWVVFVKIVLVSLLIVLVFAALGEFQREDWVFAKALFRQENKADATPCR